MSLPAGAVTVEEEEWNKDFSKMNTVDIIDKGGNSLKLQRIGEKNLSRVYEPSRVQSIPYFNLRADDIYLCAFPRTGTHWLFEIVSMLLNGSAETIRKFKGRHHLEAAPHEKLAALPSPRLLNTHLQLSDAPLQLAKKGCKILYNLRDPKDVAVSLYNFYKDSPFTGYCGKFADFLYLFLEGRVDCSGYFHHIRDAEKFLADNPQCSVFFHIYEDTIKNPVRTVQRLGDFLGIERREELCTAIADKCDFSNMVVDKDMYGVKYYGKNRLYRKGIVGDWKNYYTEQMLDDYYRVYDEKMAGSRFYELYCRDKYV